MRAAGGAVVLFEEGRPAARTVSRLDRRRALSGPRPAAPRARPNRI